MKGRVYQRRRRDGKPYGSFTAVVDVGRDSATGKRKQLTRNRDPETGQPFKSRREAQKWVRSVLTDVDKGIYRQPTKETLAAYLRRWVEALRPPAGNLRQSTWLKYRTLSESYIIPRLGSVLVQQLAPDQLDLIYSELLTSGRVGGNGRKGGGPLSPSTVNAVHVVLHRALKDGVRKGLVLRNVADFADPPRPVKPEIECWTREEARAFLEALRENRLYAAYHLALASGMRRGELLGLRWADVDLDKGMISVRQQLVASVSYEARIEDVKTASSRRTIALDPETVAVLRAWKRRQLEDRMAWGEAWQDSGLVSTRENGSPTHPILFSEWFEKAVRAAGVKRITVHGLRHTHATLALKARIPVKVVSRRLGHASIRITLDTYAHVIPDDDQEAAVLFAEKILGG
jgi:integrase